MSLAVVLALLTALAYGVANYAGPRLARDAPTLVVIGSGQLVALSLSVLFVIVLGAPQATLETTMWGLIAGIGNGFGVLLFYKAAKLGPLSIVVPIGALGVIVPVAAGLLAGESATSVKLLGIALGVGGMVVASKRGEDDGDHLDPRAAAIWAAGSAVAFGLFLAALAPAAEGGVFAAVATSRSSMLAIVVCAGIALHRPLTAPLHRLWRLAIPGVLLFSGTLAYSLATRLGELSIVSVVASLFPVVTVSLAYTFAGERLTRTQAVGVVAALCGVVLLSVR
ncbi:MAG: EamA family transporter [Thermoleophilaceae bacterium]|nr:EamA family transporter [Thermoleophilaceae bacterium]